MWVSVHLSTFNIVMCSTFFLLFDGRLAGCLFHEACHRLSWIISLSTVVVDLLVVSFLGNGEIASSTVVVDYSLLSWMIIPSWKMKIWALHRSSSVVFDELSSCGRGIPFRNLEVLYFFEVECVAVDELSPH